MRVVDTSVITETVREMCINTSRRLPDDVRGRMLAMAAEEESENARRAFRQLEENWKIAEEDDVPMCSDTGIAVLFVDVGDEVHFTGPHIRDAINEGVRQGFKAAWCRSSTTHPFTRINTGDNTPATIHFDIVPGDKVRIGFMAKGGGSESMSMLEMVTPSEGWEGVKKRVLKRVAEAGPNPCPPIVVGIGVGGNFEMSAILAKKGFLRKIDDVNPDPDLAAKEAELLAEINKLGIGPMALGGKSTCMGVKIAIFPCHIATFPVAINIQCHTARHTEVEI